ncbi:hypothetical protein AB0D94_37170 [Streptomyces sp. NPDC048255]|uniref:hypothetical protein n=1 Tax=Streptomyces sp. NPDC048255 TaxID=3154713 RepID=UPI003410E51C
MYRAAGVLLLLGYDGRDGGRDGHRPVGAGGFVTGGPELLGERVQAAGVVGDLPALGSAGSLRDVQLVGDRAQPGGQLVHLPLEVGALGVGDEFVDAGLGRIEFPGGTAPGVVDSLEQRPGVLLVRLPGFGAFPGLQQLEECGQHLGRDDAWVAGVQDPGEVAAAGVDRLRHVLQAVQAQAAGEVPQGNHRSCLAGYRFARQLLRIVLHRAVPLVARLLRVRLATLAP